MQLLKRAAKQQIEAAKSNFCTSGFVKYGFVSGSFPPRCLVYDSEKGKKQILWNLLSLRPYIQGKNISECFISTQRSLLGYLTAGRSTDKETRPTEAEKHSYNWQCTRCFALQLLLSPSSTHCLWLITRHSMLHIQSMILLCKYCGDLINALPHVSQWAPTCAAARTQLVLSIQVVM